MIRHGHIPCWVTPCFVAPVGSASLVTGLLSCSCLTEAAMSLKDIRNLDYTVLLCTDMAATRAFYRDTMRFALVHDEERWVSFQVGATLLTLKPRGPSLAWDDGEKVAGAADVQLAFRVPPSSLDACYDELIANQVEILQPPADLPAWRHRTLFFRDPEGNVIEIYAEI